MTPSFDCPNIIAEVFRFVKSFCKVFSEKIVLILKLANFCDTMVISFILYGILKIKIPLEE